LDDLDVAYLTLVRDALRHEVAPGGERDLRQTLRDLGDAIGGLPRGVSASPVEIPLLRQNAQIVGSRAEHETDPVVAASLRRQAEALLRRAEAAEQTNVLARRTAFLRQELAAQVEALRAGLAALGNTSSSAPVTATNPAALSRLSETVRTIADEAQALAHARAELDEPSVTVRENPARTPAPAVAVAGGYGPERTPPGYRVETNASDDEPDKLRQRLGRR
jgi:hypothetical protein